MNNFPQTAQEQQQIAQIAAQTLAATDATSAAIMTYEMMPDPNGKRQKAMSPQEAAFYSKKITVLNRIDKLGQRPATVVNINPFRLEVLGPLFSDIHPPANKPGQRFGALVIKDVKFAIDEGLDRQHTPIDFWPIQLAEEFTTQYAERGGVFCIDGDLQKNPNLEHTEEFKAKYKAADSQLIKNCRALKAEGDAHWNSPNHSQARNIHPPHRIAAQILLERKLLAKAPDWMDPILDAEDVTSGCPMCKAATQKGQLICPCTWILDPAGAFKAGAIDEHNVALERLNRGEVEALGVSPFVAETADEKPKRLAEGLSKPLSRYELRLQEAERKRAADAAKKAEPSNSEPKSKGKDKPEETKEK